MRTLAAVAALSCGLLVVTSAPAYAVVGTVIIHDLNDEVDLETVLNPAADTCIAVEGGDHDDDDEPDEYDYRITRAGLVGYDVEIYTYDEDENLCGELETTLTTVIDSARVDGVTAIKLVSS